MSPSSYSDVPLRGSEQDWELLKKKLERETWRMRGMVVTIQFRPRRSVSGSRRNWMLLEKWICERVPNGRNDERAQVPSCSIYTTPSWRGRQHRNVSLTLAELTLPLRCFWF